MKQKPPKGPGLFDRVPPPLNKLDAKFRAWLVANEPIMRLFERFSREKLERQQPFGAKALVERVRWEVDATIKKDTDGYRLNNNLTAYIARELIRRIPALAPLLEIRELKAATDESES